MFQTQPVAKFKTCILCSKTFSPPKIVPFEMMRKNIVELDTPQMAI